MRRWFPKTIAMQTYLITTLIVTIIVLVFGWLHASETKKRILAEQERTLTAIVTTLEQKVDSFERILATANAQHLPEEQALNALHAALQPIVDEVASKYPGYGMGYGTYNCKLAFHPFRPDGFSTSYDPKALAVYEKKKINLVMNPVSPLWSAPTMLITYPLFSEGKMFGHTWANVRLSDIYYLIYLEWGQIFLFAFVAWLGLIALLHLTFNKIHDALQNFSDQILIRHDLDIHLDKLPELQSVLKAVIELRESLKIQEHKYRTLVENFADSVMRFDRDCRLVYYNPAARRRLGEDLPLGKPPSKFGFLTDEFCCMLEDTIRQVLNDGIRKELTYSSKYFSNNAPLRYFIIAFEPEEDDSGQVTSVLGVSRDVTELKEAKTRFTKAFNMNPNITALVSEVDRTYIDVNEAFLTATGYGREDIIGQSVDQICLWADKKKSKEAFRVFRSQGYLRNYEISYNTKNGNSAGLLSVERIMLRGVTCALAVITDITAKKQLDSELARLDRLNLVGEMAAGIGHEVRNPMTTVRGYLQLFQCNPKFALYIEQIKTMIEEIDRANSIISEFLSLAKNKVSEMTLGNLNETISVIFPLLQADAFRNGHQLEMELAKIPNTIFNEKEIRQLVLNLVRNGMEAMESPGLIAIKTYSSSDNIILEVSDTGKGIPSDLLDKIGTPFFSTKENGTGLGLAVCYRIAQRHKARIEVISYPGCTTFSVKFVNTGIGELSKQIAN